MSNKFLLGVVCGASFYFTGSIIINRQAYKNIKVEEPKSIRSEGDNLIKNFDNLIVSLDKVNAGLQSVDENLQKTIKSCKE